MMAAKLEWVHSICPESGDQWVAGKWNIFLWKDGRFIVQSDKAACDSPLCYQLSDAQAWCQSQEDAAAPAELPAPGDVWGVPGKPLTRRFVRCLDVINGVCFSDTEWPHSWTSLDAWHSWARDTGAVTLASEAAARVAALEAEVVRLRKYETLFDTLMESLKTMAPYDAEDRPAVEGLLDKIQEVNRLKQERDDLRAKLAKLQSEHEAVQEERNRLREWKASVSNAIQNAPEFAAGEWGGNKDGWGYHFEVVQYLIRNRDELRAKVGLMEEEAKEMEQELADAVKSRNAFEDQVESAKETIDSLGEKVLEAEAGRGTPLKGATYVRVGRAAGRAEMRERAEKAEKERDELRAAVGRLMEALRGIAQHKCTSHDHPTGRDCWFWANAKASEIVAKEEGGRG